MSYYQTIVKTFFIPENFKELLPNNRVHINQLLKLTNNTHFSKELLSNNSIFFSEFISNNTDSFRELLANNTAHHFQNLYRSIQYY